jgi:hypothetical protein
LHDKLWKSQKSLSQLEQERLIFHETDAQLEAMVNVPFEPIWLTPFNSIYAVDGQLQTLYNEIHYSAEHAVFD